MIDRAIFIVIVATLSTVAADYFSNQSRKRSGIQSVQTPSAVNDPLFVSCDRTSSLTGKERVVGIIHDGKAKAYLVAAMHFHGGLNPNGPGVHVVNDTLNGKPVAITYSQLADQVAVFTSVNDSPFQVLINGYLKNELALELKGKVFLQSEPLSQLKNMEFELCTFDQWNEHHPNSKYYVGSTKKHPNISPYITNDDLLKLGH